MSKKAIEYAKEKMKIATRVRSSLNAKTRVPAKILAKELSLLSNEEDVSKQPLKRKSFTNAQTDTPPKQTSTNDAPIEFEV